jgi:hypothetical protein
MRVWATWWLVGIGLALGWSNASIGAPPQPGDIQQHSEGACSPLIVNNEGHVSISCPEIAPEALLYLENQLSEQFGRLNEQLRGLNDSSRTIRNLNDLNDNLRKRRMTGRGGIKNCRHVYLQAETTARRPSRRMT